MSRKTRVISCFFLKLPFFRGCRSFINKLAKIHFLFLYFLLQEVIPIPEMVDPFKNREKVKDEIKCAYPGHFFELASLVFAALGVISEGFDIALILEPMSWLLLAIVFGVLSIPSYMKSVSARHLYGIESERKKE